MSIICNANGNHIKENTAHKYYCVLLVTCRNTEKQNLYYITIIFNIPQDIDNYRGIRLREILRYLYMPID